MQDPKYENVDPGSEKYFESTALISSILEQIRSMVSSVTDP